MRMLRSVEDLMKIVMAIINSVNAMLNLLTFVLLIMVLFAILGMQLFGGKFKPELVWMNGTQIYLPPRSNFDEFGAAMLTLFKLISGGGGTWDITYVTSVFVVHVWLYSVCTRFVPSKYRSYCENTSTLCLDNFGC
jgi:nitrate reductase NapE component